MRVLAVSAKGRRLQAGPDQRIRPTADKVKGALFSILASRFDLAGARVLDLFAGSGALGIEALSRGAGHATFVEKSRPAAAILRQNLAACRVAERAVVIEASIQQALARLEREAARFDGVVLDPPYGLGLVDATLSSLAATKLLAADAWVIVEHHADEPPAQAYGSWRLTQSRRYGKTCLALLTTDTNMPIKHEPPKSSRAVYAGSFDPITNGHLDIVRRAVQVFDEVTVAVAMGTSDPKKDRAMFSADERVSMIRESLQEIGIEAKVDKFTGLLVDYCEKVGVAVIIRGLRAVSDFEYEFQMAMMNRHMKPGIETFFMTTSVKYFYTASRLVKEVVSLGGDVTGLLPSAVHRELLRKLQAQG